MESEMKTATDFQKFEALTRRILTTPKSELVKASDKAKARKATTKKRQ